MRRNFHLTGQVLHQEANGIEAMSACLGKNPYHEFLHLHRRRKRRLLLVVTCFEKCVGRLFCRSVAVNFLSNQFPSSRFLPVLIMNTSLIPAPFFGRLQFLLQLDLLLKMGS